MANSRKSESLNVLIVGGGCAGPALAYWLVRSGHRVTILERFPALRATGAQVDLRGQGIEAIRRMGLLDAVKTSCVDEPGVAFVDSKGRPWATLMANISGKGAQSLTSEYEIMRGDLVRILYEATKHDVNYVFGQTVEHFEEQGDHIIAQFSDGSRQAFDLLVAADGQGSRTRRAILPVDAPEPYLRMGVHMAYWFIPRVASDSNIRDTYCAPGGRMIMRRSHNSTETQVYFILRESSEEASAIHRATLDRQKRFWSSRFSDAGWQVPRFIEGMKSSEFFHSQEVVQVRADSWSSGRVVLLGDAAYCPSPFSGMGVSSSLVGAYVLAGEISRCSDHLSQALRNYESTLWPYVNTVQAAVKPRLLRVTMPRTQVGVLVLRAAAALAITLKIPGLVARFSSTDRDGDWKLPEYEALDAPR